MKLVLASLLLGNAAAGTNHGYIKATTPTEVRTTALKGGDVLKEIDWR